MKRLLGALGACTALATLLAGSPADAAGPTRIDPPRLERGDDIAIPHLRGGDVVDGDRRVDVPGRSAVLLGASGAGYVVTSLAGGTWTTYRVGVGEPEVVVSGPFPEQLLLADGGGRLAVTRDGAARRTVVRVLAVPSGRRVARGVFDAFPRVLDLRGNRAVVGGPDGGSWWNLRTGRTRVIDTGFVYAADIGADRIASFDKDPYEGGCSSVSTIKRPRELYWTSCREAVRAFSPDGSRIVTQHKLTDGLGAGQLWERTTEGRWLASYTVGSHFGGVRWESDTDVLLDAYGPRRWAVVRCSEGACERATRVRPNPSFRVSPVA